MSPEPARRADEERLAATVSRQAARKLAGRRASTRELWFGLGLFGVVGWSIALPAVVGALTGAWLDRAHPGGVPWTLAGLAAGLGLGFVNAWRWVAHEQGRGFDGETREEPRDG